ncbi:hypothetical protein ACA910_017928 [Epithemia clementina (nom. ined.)]
MEHRRNLRMILAILGISFYCYYISLIGNRGFRKTVTKYGSSLRVTPSSQRHQSYAAHEQERKGTSGAKETECTIYVAPSSLKGNPGYGIFTTRNVWKGEKILGGPDGVAIPVEGYDQLDVPKGDLKKQWIQLWDPYWWGRGVPDHVAFEAGPDIVDFQIGFGYLPNHHCELSSLNPGYPQDTPYEDSLANRFESPGAGAFSYNIGREFSSTRDVKAGEELFMSYGYCKHGSGPGWTNDVYMPAEFNVASDIIWNRIGPHANESFHFDGSGNVVLEDSVVGNDTATVKAKLVKELLPETKEQVQRLAAAPLTREDLPKYLASKRGVNPRTPEWIRENGMCLETLVARKSTLPHAGQGAFARFSIKKGSIVTMAPVLHIMDKDVLALYEGQTESEAEEGNDDDYEGDSVDKEGTKGDGDKNSGSEDGESVDRNHPRQVGTQLLLNYCFSNPHSTVLLCPATNAVLVNHCSKRKQQCGPNGPNADYRWSSGWDPTSDEWRRQSLEELATKSFRGLSFEIYALRDIAPGEEVFIDYGEAWEQAWEEHVRQWKPRSVPKNWISAKEANEMNDEPILEDLLVGTKLVEEGATTTFGDHPYLMTGCVYWTTDMDYDEVFENATATLYSNNKKNNIDDMLKTFSDDGSRYEYPNNKGYASHEDGLHWPCSVVYQETGNDKDYDDDDSYQDTYVVQIQPNPTYPGVDDIPWVRNGLPRLLRHFPRSSIRYFVKPYASDQHLPGVFRQPIGMRDDLFPEQWKNIPDSK